MNNVIKGVMVAVIAMGCPFVTLAADTTINLTGKITAAACTVDNNGMYQIELPDVPSVTLASAGSFGEWTTVNVTLSACPVGTTQVTATFGGTVALGDINKHGVAVGTGYAKNVDLQLQDAAGTKTDLGVNSSLTVPVDGNRNATFALRLRPYSIDGSATIGAIEGLIVAEFNYN